MVKQTKIIMGTPITIHIVDDHADSSQSNKLFAYFRSIDKRFSPFNMDSELSHINTGDLLRSKASHDMQTVLDRCEETKQATDGYFDILHNEMMDPSGLVKGWAIQNAVALAKDMGVNNFFIDMGNDLYVGGMNEEGKKWEVGLRNPSQQYENKEILSLSDKGISTSSSYVRGQHIYDPFTGREPDDIMSITVIAPNAYDADRFSTAAFAMGKKGIDFIQAQSGLEGYMVDRENNVTMTKGFSQYLTKEKKHS